LQKQQKPEVEAAIVVARGVPTLAGTVVSNGNKKEKTFRWCF
jgi:hypothetical protein